MRKSFFIALIFSVVGSFAQSYKILIDGHVVGSDMRNKIPIINAIIYLSTDLGDEIISFTDTNGYYSFTFSKVAFKKAKISIESNKNTRAIGEKHPCYLASKDFSEIILPDTGVQKHYIKDFKLLRVSHCNEPYIPKIMFKHQSLIFDTVFSSHYINKSDSLLDIPANAFVTYVKILKDNPTLIIQISGHSSSNEKTALELSRLRAEKVKSEIIKFGINQDRIIAKGLGDSRPLVNPEIINKAKTKKEKASLHTKNRRCTFSIISWDYGKTPEQLKKESDKNKLNEEDE